MTIAKALLSAVTLASLTAVFAAEAPKDDDSKKPKAPPTEKEIKALIDQLVSPNPKPIIDTKGPPRTDLPPGFDLKKQDKVHFAQSQLVELDPVAFPFLIESWNDERYSLTTCNYLSGWFYNESVGRVCQTIIFNQLQPYGYWQDVGADPRGKPTRPSYPDHFLGSQKAAKAWWEQNKQKTLNQMQLEVLDWVIAEEAKRRGDFTDKEKQSLQEIRKELLKGPKPLPAGNFYANGVTYH